MERLPLAAMVANWGGAVAAVLTEHAPCKLQQLAFTDIFGESGDNEKIFSEMGVNTENIIAMAKEMKNEGKTR